MQETFLILGSIYFLLGSVWFVGTLVAAYYLAQKVNSAQENLTRRLEPVEEILHRLKNPLTLMPVVPIASFILRRVRRLLR